MQFMDVSYFFLVLTVGIINDCYPECCYYVVLTCEGACLCGYIQACGHCYCNYHGL